MSLRQAVIRGQKLTIRPVLSKDDIIRNLTKRNIDLANKVDALTDALREAKFKLNGQIIEPPIIARRPISIREIVEEVSRRTCMDVMEILGDRRDLKTVEARHIAMYLACKLTTNSLPAIGRIFKRDHTSVLHARERIRGRLLDDGALGRIVSDCRYELEKEAERDAASSDPALNVAPTANGAGSPIQDAP